MLLKLIYQIHLFHLFQVMSSAPTKSVIYKLKRITIYNPIQLLTNQSGSGNTVKLCLSYWIIQHFAKVANYSSTSRKRVWREKSLVALKISNISYQIRFQSNLMGKISILKVAWFSPSSVDLKWSAKQYFQIIYLLVGQIRSMYGITNYFSTSYVLLPI